jgi:hypothetical protein
MIPNYKIKNSYERPNERVHFFIEFERERVHLKKN